MLASRQRHTGSLSRHVQVIITFVLRKLLQNIAHAYNSGWTHWRLHPQNQTKMRMGDLFLIHPDSNSLLRRSWTNECHSIKNLQISFRSRWTGPTWWTVETRWSFSLGKLCPVSSVRRWTQDVSFKVVFVSTRFFAPDVWGLTAELHRREPDRPAWTRQWGQRETSKFCGQFLNLFGSSF